MVSWRPVNGQVHRIDGAPVSADEVLKFFTEQRVLGRGEITPDGSYAFELAVGGRRRRVATLDEDYQVFLGYPVSDLLKNLGAALGSVTVSLGEKNVYEPNATEVLAVAELTEESGAEAQEQDSPSLVRGTCVLAVGDFRLSELPVLAAAENVEIAAYKIDEVHAVLAHKPIDLTARLFPKPDYCVQLSFDGADLNTAFLAVTRDSATLTWDWSGEAEPFPWVIESSAANDFVDDELGAGAVARRAVADLVDASFADVRDALLMPKEAGVKRLVRLLGLPDAALEYLRAGTSLRALVGARVFYPKSRPDAIEDALAWEVSGHGIVEPTLAHAYRTVYLRRPWLVAAVAAVQAGVGLALSVKGFQKLASGRRRSRIVGGIGVGLVASAATRMLITTYVQSVVERTNPVAPLVEESHADGERRARSAHGASARREESLYVRATPSGEDSEEAAAN